VKFPCSSFEKESLLHKGRLIRTKRHAPSVFFSGFFFAFVVSLSRNALYGEKTTKSGFLPLLFFFSGLKNALRRLEKKNSHSQRPLLLIATIEAHGQWIISKQVHFFHLQWHKFQM
jgi:hypothetical protein